MLESLHFLHFFLSKNQDNVTTSAVVVARNDIRTGAAAGGRFEKMKGVYECYY